MNSLFGLMVRMAVGAMAFGIIMVGWAIKDFVDASDAPTAPQRVACDQVQGVPPNGTWLELYDCEAELAGL